MKKILPLICLLIGLGMSVNGQTITTIAQIQTPVNLSACNDTSQLFGDTVTIRAVVVMDGGLAQAASGRNIWLQSGNGGPNSGLDLFGFSTATSPDDVLNLVAGDSVEITGYIDEFRGESEIRPLQAGTSCTILGSGTVTSSVVDICDLNDTQRNNELTTGEQWEGAFIELQNVTVSSVDPFSGGTRVSFEVQNSNGCKINVSDRFLVQRLPGNGGTFVPPNVGDTYTSLKGVLAHSINDCPGTSGRGYELYPFDTSHYQISSAAPAITSITRNPITPSSSQAATISANITDSDGIASATLFYAIGAGSSTYLQVPMTTSGGSLYTADIPAQADGTFVKYYICATDNSNATACVPDVGGSGADPLFYTVRDNGTTIYDVQFVPTTFNSANSGYLNLDVTVEGVVTASAEPGNLGFVFIQEEGRNAWAGIPLTNNAGLANLRVGQKVEVTGTVRESFGMTRIEDVSSINVTGTGTITPTQVEPQIFKSYDFAVNEQYEGMLLTYVNNASPGNLFIVQANADGPNNNFAEWLVGKDQFDPAETGRGLSGRQTNSAFSSLNVSWVNDSSWATTDGIMNVGVCLLADGMQIDSVTGIMYYSFGAFKLMPRNNSDTHGFPPCAVSTVNPQDLDIVAYPNPANNTLRIKYALDGIRTESSASLYDLMGRKVAETQLNGQNGIAELNVSNLPTGNYLLSIRSGADRLYTTRILIAR